jgi:uncharacterized protein YjiS (DUF1127 family)
MTHYISTLREDFKFADYNIFRNLFKSYRAYLLMRQTRDQLQAMSNRELNDIGISRCDIQYIANQCYLDELKKD